MPERKDELKYANRIRSRIPFDNAKSKRALDSGGMRSIAALTRTHRSGARKLTKSAEKVIDYIERHPNAVLVSSAVELAARVDASDATVIRAIQALGYDGLPHLKSVIAARLDAGARTAADRVRVTVEELRSEEASPFALTIDAYTHTLETLDRSLTGAEIARASAILAKAPRIRLYGPGPCSQLSQQTAIHLERIGRRASMLAGAGGNFADSLLTIADGDALLALAFGKVQREGLLAAREIRARGGSVVVITDNRSGRMSAEADVVILIPRTEVGNMMMYGLVLMALESILLSLTRDAPERAVATARRLDKFRADLAGDADGER
jgi:DNA-binding MurR/RpiR family transcriptional regulator